MSEIFIFWVVYSIYFKIGDELNVIMLKYCEWFDQYYCSGVFLISGCKFDGIGGVLICWVDSEQELCDLFCDDFFVQGGFVEYVYMLFILVKCGWVLDLDGVLLVE